jgi:hypothetical protein
MTHREEPGKQKTRRRWAQELSRSCARKNAWWKWKVDRIVQLAFGETGVACCGIRELLDARARWTRNESVSQTRSQPLRALLAENPPQGGPLMSQLGSAGLWARVRLGRAWKATENSEKEELCRGQDPDDEMTE